VKISATRAGHALFGRRIAGDALAGTLALFCLANSLLMVNFQVSRLFLLDEAGYGDSYILYDALHFKATGVIYRDLSQPPYLPAQYSPLLYMLYSFPGQIGTFPNPLVGPRLIALAAFLSCVAVVISIVRTPVPARYAWLWGSAARDFYYQHAGVGFSAPRRFSGHLFQPPGAPSPASPLS